MDWKNIGARIRKQRENLGYTREAFSEKLDVTPKFCSDIELGIKGMSVTTLSKISVVLGLSVDYILYGKETEELDSTLVNLIMSCPQEKRPFLVDMIKTFILSTKD